MTSTPHKKIRGMLVAMVAAIIAMASFPASAADLEEELMVPLSIDLSASSSDCANNPGPWVHFSDVGDVKVELVFRINMKGTHERIEESTTSVALDFSDDPIVLPKQPARGGVGGNPHIWVAISSDEDDTGEIYLGRCNQDV